MTNNQTLLHGETLVNEIVEQALSKKANNVSVLDLKGQSAPADWFVICEGENSVHNRAIYTAVREGVKEKGTAPWHTEGGEDGRWVVVDYSDVVVHIMLPDLRKFYSLETLWNVKIDRRSSNEHDTEADNEWTFEPI